MRVNILIFSLLRFHTNSTATSTGSDEKTCALCLNVMETANVKKICNSCMSKHNFSLSKPQLHLCNLCKQSIEGDKFQNHLIEHEFENKSISCIVCDAIFKTVLELKEHLRGHKLAHINFKEACSKCNAKFLYNSELLHHTKEHEIVEEQANQNIKQESEDDNDIIMKTVKYEEPSIGSRPPFRTPT